MCLLKMLIFLFLLGTFPAVQIQQEVEAREVTILNAVKIVFLLYINMIVGQV